jgi:hypothetical protein
MLPLKEHFCIKTTGPGSGGVPNTYPAARALKMHIMGSLPLQQGLIVQSRMDAAKDPLTKGEILSTD